MARNASNVVPMTRLSDPGRMRVAATRMRNADDFDGPELATAFADLLDEIADAVEHRNDDPAMNERETWRWSATVGRATRVARRWTS